GSSSRRSAEAETRARPGARAVGHRDDLRRRAASLPRDALPPVWAKRARPTRDLARAVAELRPRAAIRDVAGGRPPSVRPRRHTLRSREQLRAALWSAEETFGRLLATELAPYRDEL